MILESIYYKLFKYSNVLKICKIIVKIIVEWVYDILFSIIFIKLICQCRSANYVNKKEEDIFIVVLIASETSE